MTPREQATTELLYRVLMGNKLIISPIHEEIKKHLQTILPENYSFIKNIKEVLDKIN